MEMISDVQKVLVFMLMIVVNPLPGVSGSPAVGVVGGEVNINITISDRSIDNPRQLWDPNGLILLIFSPKAANAAYINPNVTYTGNIPGGFVSFTLSKLTIQSAGIYQYTISKGTSGNVIAGEQNLIIAGMPNTPVIRTFSEQAIAGREFKLNCNAVSTSQKPGHNLTMFSEWKRNGINIRSDDAKYGVNDTILTIRNLSRTDNNVSLTCVAFEDQRVKSLDSTAFPLNVYYGPDSITLTPSQMSYELAENSSLNVTCLADCVPGCQYRWTGPDVIYSDKTGILFISMISRSQTGVFTCTASNPNITSNSATANVSVTVMYGPENITLSPSQMSYDLVENSSLNVNCSADCVPSCQYRWTGPGVNYSDKTGIWFISKISRNQTGVFTCTAFNPNITSNYATAVMSVKVTVQYGPDSITLSPRHMSYDLVENSSFTVNCSSDCVPSCQYRWTGLGVNYPDKTGILSISKISRSQTGVFTCTAFNPNITSNSATANVSVIVQYGPDNIKLSTSQMSYEVVENSSFNVNCSADCVPSCQYIWTGPGNSYPDKTGIFSISKISRHQTGVYTCVVTNPSITSNSATATVLVTVQYPPSIQGLTSPYKVIEDQPLNVTCVATSNPPADRIFWSPRGEGSVNSILYFSSVSRNNSGIYNCTAQNTMTPTDGIQHIGTTTSQIVVDVQYTDNPKIFPLAAVAGGIGAGVGVILVVGLAVFLVRRYPHQKPFTDGIKENETERTRPESGLVDNPVYDTSGPLPGPSAGAVITEAEYAKVNKPKKKASNMNEASNIYAQVNKTKTNFKKGDIYENAADLVVNTKAEPCNKTLYEDAGATGLNGPLINKDGLHYADLVLVPPSKKDGKDIIRGIENRTEYAEIAYGKRGEPLPDSDN